MVSFYIPEPGETLAKGAMFCGECNMMVPEPHDDTVLVPAGGKNCIMPANGDNEGSCGGALTRVVPNDYSPHGELVYSLGEHKKPFVPRLVEA